MADDDLPDVWRSADRACLAGQHATMRLALARLGGSLVAAVGGAITWTAGRADLAAILIAGGFVVALIGEIVSWVRRPEAAWYDVPAPWPSRSRPWPGATPWLPNPDERHGRGRCCVGGPQATCAPGRRLRDPVTGIRHTSARRADVGRARHERRDHADACP